MYKKQMTIQRILCLAAIIASVVVFLYALGIMTDLYDSLYVANNFGVKGAEVYFNMQPFNQMLLVGSIVMILLGAFLFITNTHIRRRYYIGNFIATGLYAAASVALTLYSHAQILIYKAQFFEVDFATLELYSTLFPTDVKYTESTFWLDAHYVIFGILVLVALLLVMNACWKVSLMKKEAKLVEAGRRIAA
ncbi:MAG: hypothetical protein J1E43_11820 [Christensenellaceae bacterium]|nr:hypothetical protein [Christensenellaceae bacterium]